MPPLRQMLRLRPMLGTMVSMDMMEAMEGTEVMGKISEDFTSAREMLRMNKKQIRTQPQNHIMWELQTVYF